MNIQNNVLIGVDRCPYCAVSNPLLTKIWGPEAVVIAGTKQEGFMRLWACYECSKCHYVMLARAHPFSVSNGRTNELNTYRVVEEILPRKESIDASLPESARNYLKQAFDTLHAPDACALMAASAIDSMLKEKGLTKGSLYQRIDAGVASHVLTSAMGRWAHEVRLEANAVRHADEERPHLTQEDARRVLDFAKALGDFLYVFTARVDAGIEEAQSSDAKAD